MTNKQQIKFIKQKTYEARKRVLDMSVAAGSGHLTSALSCAEIVSTLYYAVMRIDPKNPDLDSRDRFILSKNHGCQILFAVLADLGFFPLDVLSTWKQNGSLLTGHAWVNVPGCDFSGGSLGMGLGIGAGLAYAAKCDSADWLTFVMVGDGETCEGSIWESAMFAGAHNLDNLVVILDCNQLAITKPTNKIMTATTYAEKFKGFGFETVEVDGHDIGALLDVFADVREHRTKPLCIIANTVKGKGISFIELVPTMHAQSVKTEDIERAYAELERSKRF